MLDLGPSLGPPEVDGAGAGLGVRPGSRSVSGSAGSGSLQVPGVRRPGLMRRLCSSSSGFSGLSGDSGDGYAGDGEGVGVTVDKKGRYKDVEGRDCDYGYGSGYDYEIGDEGAGQHPVLTLPCDDGVDDAHADAEAHGHAHGRGRGHDNEHEHEDRDNEVTVSSPLLVPLKTSRKAKRGVSWSKASKALGV